MSTPAALRHRAYGLYRQHLPLFLLASLAFTLLRLGCTLLANQLVIWIDPPNLFLAQLLQAALWYLFTCLTYPFYGLGYRRMTVRAMLGERPRLAVLHPGSLAGYGQGVRFALAFELVLLARRELPLLIPAMFPTAYRYSFAVQGGINLLSLLLLAACWGYYASALLSDYLFLRSPGKPPFALIRQAFARMRGHWGEYFLHLGACVWWYLALLLLANGASLLLNRLELASWSGSIFYALLSVAVPLLPYLAAEPFLLLSLGGYADQVLNETAPRKARS